MQPINLLDALAPTERDQPARQPNGTLGREDFLRMLIAQLENQDPLNPQDPTQFTAQLAQFSTLEQLISIRSAIEEIAAPDSVDRVVSAAQLIGREVVVRGNQFSVDRSGSTLSLEMELPAPTTSTRVIVTDAAGTRVRTLDLGRLGAGRHTIDAVREDDFGQPLQPGLYQFSVDARSGAESVSALTFVRGRVTGLAAAEDESASPEVRIGSLELPIDSLLEIRSVDEPK